MHDMLYNEHSQNFRDINEYLIKINSSISALNIEINNLKDGQELKNEETKSIVELATSVKYLTEAVVNLVGEVRNHNERISTLENKPGKVALSYWHILITAIIATFVTTVFPFFKLTR